MSVFEMLKKTLQLYKRFFFLLIGYTAWTALPYIALFMLSLVESRITIVGITLVALALTFLWIYITIMLTLISVDLVHDKKPNIQVHHKHAKTLIWPLLVVSFLVSGAVLGGFLLFIIPGLIFMVWFAFAQISVIADKKRNIAALTFSRNLVQGRFFQTGCKLFGGIAILYSVYVLIFLGVLLGWSQIAHIDVVSFVQPTEAPLWIQGLSSMGDIVLVPVLILYSVVLYEELKKTKLSES